MPYGFNHGMGSTADLPQSIFGGGPVDCTKNFTWLVTPECWHYSTSAWEQVVAFQQPPSSVIKPPPAVGAGTSTVPAPYACSDGSLTTAATNCPEYSSAVDASIAQGKALTDQALLDWYGQQAPVTDPSSTNWLLYGALAAVGLVALVFVGGGSPRRYGR